MSSASYICLKSGGRAEAPDGLDGYAVVFPWAQPALDQIAESIGATPPSHFVYADRARYAEGLDDGEIPPSLQAQFDEQPEWHDAQVGLWTFAALLKYIEDHPGPTHQLIGVHNDLESVRLTVDVMRRILEAAMRNGNSFRIEHEF